MTGLAIRDATLDDLPAMLGIYNEIVIGSTAIFSDRPRTEPEQVEWYSDRCAQGRPVLVACDEAGIAGFASYGPFRAWPGYRMTVENSIYLAAHARGRGHGTQLLSALVQRAIDQGLHAMIAGIDGDNEASMRLHAKLGFVRVAHLKEVGRKFDRWLDLVFYQRLLAAEGTQPPPHS
jgi:phosphinothricin acetyltransferase